jgi:hypothetical protein
VADIGFQGHRIDLGVRGGYKLGKETGMAGYGRLGYHYNRVGINDVENFMVNIPKLPSEILSGPTIGVMLDVPQFNPQINFRISADYLISGKRVQTLGLEDGQLSTAKGIWGSAKVEYQWKPDMKASANYQYSGLTTDWQGTAPNSMRDHTLGAAPSTAAKRKDTTHAIFIGLSRGI